MPNCNDPSKFSDRRVYANSVDPDHTPVPSGFTMFAILSASYWLIMSKNDSRSRMVFAVFLIFENEENKRSPVMKKTFFCICENKDAVTA